MSRNNHQHSEDYLYLTPSDFEEVFGESLSAFIKDKINKYGFKYRLLTEQEKDSYLIKIVSTLLDPSLVKAGEHRLPQWEKGWEENYNQLTSDFNENLINPKYFGKHDILRWKQCFIQALSDSFESGTLSIIVYWLLEKYAKDVEAIYEFGCGTGHHLLRAREINKKAQIWGLDWATSSQKIIKKFAREISDNKIFSQRFNFFHPDSLFHLSENSLVFTVAALEQVGKRHRKFIKYLIRNKPKICVHIEPIEELLDNDNLLDNLSIRYFKKRNYLSGFLKYLQELEDKGVVEILMVKRSYIGSFFIDGYSIVVWKPI